MKFGKRQLVLASLVLALGAAVYLTWQFSGNNNLAITTSGESSELGAAQLVNNQYVETVNDGLTGTKPVANLSEARMTRQSSRDEAIELLNKVLKDETLNDDSKSDAMTQASAIAQNILTETNIENLLSAKGFQESVAYINNGGCNVVVSGELKENDSVVIQEVVIEQTGFTADKIKMISAK